MSLSYIAVPPGMLLDPPPTMPEVIPTRDSLAEGRTELALGSELTCLKDRIRVTVPVELVLRHGLTPGMVTWRSDSCVSSLMEDGGLVLETNHSTCGSTVTVTSSSLAFSNEVRSGILGVCDRNEVRSLKCCMA